MSWREVCATIADRIEGRPTAAEIRRTPEFRAAFMRALARHIIDRVVPKIRDEDVERCYQDFVAGQSNTYEFLLTVKMVEGDTYFMAYLHEESRRQP